MRPSRQTKIITSHLDGFVNLRERLQIVLDQINNIIEKGETWIEGNDDVSTFSQFNQFLDSEMSSCLNQLCVIAGENEDGIQTLCPVEHKILEDQLQSTDLSSRQAINVYQLRIEDFTRVKEELEDLKNNFSSLTSSIEHKEKNDLALDKKYEELKNSSDILLKKYRSFKEKHRGQSQNVESRFDVVMTELHTASDFIQTQSEIFFEKIKHCENKCSFEINEKINTIELKLKEIILENQEEYDNLNNKKLSEINVEMKKQTKELNIMRQTKECLSSKVNDIQKELKDIPIRIDKLEMAMANIPQSTSTYNQIAKVPGCFLPEAVNQNDAQVTGYKVTSKGTVLYGNCETQVAQCGEPMLEYLFRNCRKNPDHTMFIPIECFTKNHLPESHRITDLYDLIKASADLTVRVDVQTVSSLRPKFWPNSHIKYPFYGVKTQALRTGSGMVCGLNKFTDGLNHYGNRQVKNLTECWCKSCQSSGKASNIWWEINFLTAAQVVFDHTEARNTSLKLFYDSPGSPAVSFNQVSFFDVNVDRDWSMLKFVTCDKDLGKKLNKLWKCYNDLLRKVWKKYEESRDVDKLTYIVSHPHGCSKHVSVGQWVDKHKVSKYVKQFTYTTCTCPGSSGARVHCVGYYASQLVHSGCLDSGLNYSGIS